MDYEILVFPNLDFEKFECNHKLWKFTEGSVNYLVVSIKEKLDRILRCIKFLLLIRIPISVCFVIYLF